MEHYISAYSGKQIDSAVGRALVGGEIDSLIQRKVNPNLLHNWYFVNPVNQRGQTEYTAVGYTIDRWFISGDPCSIKVESNGISLTGTGKQARLRQYVEDVSAISGKTVTYSVLMEGNVLLTDSGKVPTSGTSSAKQFCGAESSTGLTMGMYRRNSMVYAQIYSPDNVTQKVIAAKVELGTEQTLANKDASGNWVLNEIPDYGETLLKCQRHFRRIEPDTTTLFFGPCKRHPISPKYHYVNIDLPGGIRAKPAYSFGGEGVAIIDQVGNEAAISSVGVYLDKQKSILMLSLQADLTVTAETQTFLRIPVGAYLDINADM